MGKMSLGSVLLAIYGFSCIFVQFSLHGLSADCNRQLYLRFQNETDVSYLKWAWDSQLDFFKGIITGCITGLAFSAPFYLIINQRQQTQEKDYRKKKLSYVAATLTFAWYLATFILASFFANPYFLKSALDLVLTFCYAGICSWSTLMFIDNIRVHKERRDFLFNKEMQLKKLEFESAFAIEILHLVSWMMVSAFVGCIAIGLYQYFYAVPPQIVGTQEFSLSLMSLFFNVIMLISGFFLGVVCQVAFNISDIIWAIKEYATWNRKRKS
jgi:hypothetical protein